jgi:CHAT domain-containing protein
VTQSLCRTMRWTLLSLLCLLPSFALAQSPPELKPEATLERALRGGETQLFQLSLPAGQFLYASVEQKGIDVEVTLLGPGGEKISRVDSNNGNWGPEPVVAIAETTGEYRLQVRSGDPGVPAGRIEVRIIELRPARDDDHKHIAAERAEEAAQDLLAQNTAASLHAAVEKFQQALLYYDSSPDHYRRAVTLQTIGFTSAQLGDFSTALDYYGKALPLFHDLGDTRMESTTLNNMGGAYDVLGDELRALDFYDRALKLSEANGERGTQAFLYNNIGKIHADMADLQKATDYYNQALPLFQALGDKDGQALALQNIGSNYLDLGDPANALEYLQQSLALRKAAGNKRFEAETLDHIAACYGALGENQKAIHSFEDALKLERDAADHWREGQTLTHLGALFSSLNQQDKALEYLQQSVALLRDAQDRRGQAVALAAIGNAYNQLGQPEKAIATETQALELASDVGDSNHMARSQLGIARAHSQLGDLDQARKDAEEALKLIEDVRAQAGGEQARASYLASQQNAYEFYVDLLMQLHRQHPNSGYDARAFEASERARARSLIEMLSEAQVDFRQGVDPTLLDRERTLAHLLDSKANRLMNLTGNATHDQSESLKKEIDDLEAKYQQAEVDIRHNSPRYAALTQPQPLTLKEIQNAVLDSDTVLLEYALGDERSHAWAVTNSSLKSYDLPERKEVEDAVRKVYELLTARSTYPRAELPGQRQTRIAQADAQLPVATQQLSTLILVPLAGDLGDKRLVVIADGALQHVPFSILPVTDDKGQPVPLVVAHEIVTLPSASTLAVLRKEIQDRKPAPNLFAVFADPVFDANDERLKPKPAAGSDPPPKAAGARILQHSEEQTIVQNLAGKRMVVPRLPYTRQEAERILQIAPKGNNLEALDFRANRAAATSPELSQYRYLHFATHGYLDSEHPELSAIVLSLVDSSGNPQDGFLRAGDIYNLKLPAELVVLSACQTGLGKEIRGEGIVGLTRGFMYAGAARVVVSLWSVNDKATEELMAAFYERLLRRNMTVSAALREAQVEMLKQKKWSNPYYWAAFVEQGEWK